MRLHFFKYQGAGNDFILIDNRTLSIKLSQEQIAFLCDRRFGIGADGLILLESSQSHDFRMHYFNSDGRLSSFCGNGGRCLVRFAHFLQIFTNQASFEAFDGIHTGKILPDGMVELSMNQVSACQSIPSGELLNTGSPHLLVVVNELENLNVREIGSKLRFDTSISEDGVNVNFVKQLSECHIAVRTYERGVEDETLACGTGVTAAALALVKDRAAGDYVVDIKAIGGDLQVKFNFSPESDFPYSNIRLIGPALQVFEGWLDLG